MEYIIMQTHSGGTEDIDDLIFGDMDTMPSDR